MSKNEIFYVKVLKKIVEQLNDDITNYEKRPSTHKGASMLEIAYARNLLLNAEQKVSSEESR